MTPTLSPTVLLATSRCWPAPLRFAEALLECGAAVHMISPARNRFVYGIPPDCRHRYGFGTPKASLRAAVLASNPDILIPGDDRVLAEFLSLHRQRRSAFGPRDGIVELIEASLGDVDQYAVLTSRAAFMSEAKALGIRALSTRAVATTPALAHAADELGHPLVLKLDHTSGGEGTAVAHDLRDAAVKSTILRSRRHRIRRKLGDVVRGEGSLLAMRSEWKGSILNAQRFVRGTPATTAFACANGRLLGAIHAKVLQEAYPNGPATVVMIVRSDEMDSNAGKIATRFRLSGLHGLDYMVEKSTGIPWLIEFNPRLTQIAHLALGLGRDLAEAVLAAGISRPVLARSGPPDSDTVALFPQEWLRDRESPFINSGYSDVPRNNPAFVQAILGSGSRRI